jgi:hypothetical protein
MNNDNAMALPRVCSPKNGALFTIRSYQFIGCGTLVDVSVMPFHAELLFGTMRLHASVASPISTCSANNVSHTRITPPAAGSTARPR